MRTSRSCGGGFRATRSAATISSPTNALPRPQGPRAAEADAVTETKEDAGDEAVAVAEAMKDRSGQARNFASAAARCASSSSTTRRSGMPCCGYCCRTPGGTASGIPALGHYLYTDETKSVGGALSAAVFHSVHLHSELAHRVQAHPPLARMCQAMCAAIQSWSPRGRSAALTTVAMAETSQGHKRLMRQAAKHHPKSHDVRPDSSLAPSGNEMRRAAPISSIFLLLR